MKHDGKYWHTGGGRHVPLGYAAHFLRRIVIECRNCQRRGVLNIDKLMNKHGADADLWSTAVQPVANQCPRNGGRDITRLCGIGCPSLAAIPEPGEVRPPIPPHVDRGPR